jgi:hypothetical protein
MHARRGPDAEAAGRHAGRALWWPDVAVVARQSSVLISFSPV